jgi:hypothetical protein
MIGEVAEGVNVEEQDRMRGQMPEGINSTERTNRKT